MGFEINNGTITPKTNADIIKTKSRLLNLNNVKKINDNTNIPITTSICADSIPSANSKSDGNLSMASP